MQTFRNSTGATRLFPENSPTKSITREFDNGTKQAGLTMQVFNLFDSHSGELPLGSIQ